MRHGCVGFNQKSGWTIALIPQNRRIRHLADFQPTLANIYQLNFVWYDERRMQSGMQSTTAGVWSGLSPKRSDSVSPRNFVDRAVRERDDEQVAVGAGLDVGADAEVAAEEGALALDEGSAVGLRISRRGLVQIVGDPVFQPRIIHPDFPAVAGQVEVPQEAPFEERPGGTHEEVAVVLRTYPAAVHEANARRGHLKLPAKLRIAVVRARQHHHPRLRLLGRVG